jgi:hypothetical protein
MFLVSSGAGTGLSTPSCRSECAHHRRYGSSLVPHSCGWHNTISPLHRSFGMSMIYWYADQPDNISGWHSALICSALWQNGWAFQSTWKNWQRKVYHPRSSNLGILIDTQRLTLSLTPRKLTALRELLAAWRVKGACSSRDLQRLIGKLSFVCSIVPAGRTFLRRMISTLVDAGGATSNAVQHVRLGNEFRRDLQWWRQFLNKWQGTSVMVTSDWSAPAGTVVTTDD